jgi:DNA-binding NarL/FixJ family response regulator
MKSLSGAPDKVGGVLVGIRHAGLAEGVGSLLARHFDPVVTAADEAELLEGVERLKARLAVVDLEFGAGDALGLLYRLREGFPALTIIVLTMDDSPTVERTVLAAGADRQILKSCISSELVPVVLELLAAPAGCALEGA